MKPFQCGDSLSYGQFPRGAGGCLVRFPELDDRALLLTAGHVVLPSFAQQGDAISDLATGQMIGRLFSWTSIDGNPTADAALIWVDPAQVAPNIRGLGLPSGVNMSPAVGEVVRIVPHSGQTQPREARIRAVDASIDVMVEGPGWDTAPTITYRGQIVTDRLISEGGDSGAIALDGKGRVLGMVVAGGTEVGTIITPIAPILKNSAWGGLQLEILVNIDSGFVAPPLPAVAAASDPVPQEAAQEAAPPATPEAFIAALQPAAIASMHDFKIPASFTLAQGALESGWGKSKLATLAKNLFGVKADASWHGDVLPMETREFINGEWIQLTASWRKYADWKQCLDDHARFFQSNPRYKDCFRESTGVGFAKAVAKAGYATDPDYANKLIAVINKRGLSALDNL